MTRPKESVIYQSSISSRGCFRAATKIKMSDDETWKEFFERWALGIIEFAAKNPKDFILYCKYQNGEAELI